MTHKFIINTENVNAYGYRILTAGIDYTQYLKNPVVLYMHNRGEYNPKGNEVIGRCINLTVESNDLIAEIEFDDKDDFAKAIAQKVEGGFLRMASIKGDVIEQSSDASLAMPGQYYETVTKMKLVEISIVDIGGNDDALKLSNGSGQPAQLKLLNTPINMSEFKTIALALGKDANIDEAATLAAVNELKLSKETAENNAVKWEAKFVALQKTEAEGIVERAVKLGLVNEALKDAQVSDLLSNFDEKKVVLNKLITDKEAEVSKGVKHTAVSAAVKLAGGLTAPVDGDEKESYDYLRKHNAVELRRIQEQEPEKYVQLCKAYGAGVRYKAK